MGALITIHTNLHYIPTKPRLHLKHFTPLNMLNENIYPMEQQKYKIKIWHTKALQRHIKTACFILTMLILLHSMLKPYLIKCRQLMTLSWDFEF